MLFILRWTETEAFQNIHEKRKIFALEEQMQSMEEDTHTLLFFSVPV